MKNLILALGLVALLGQGCTSAQLAADEQKALAALQKLHGVLSSGVALADAQKAADVALAVDPSSPLLQKVNQQVHSAAVASDLNKADVVTVGAISVLGGVAPVTGSTGK